MWSEWGDQIRRQEPLAPRTQLRLGGPAQYYLEPTSVDQLAAVLRRCHDSITPVRVLGSGTNLLVRDEGVSGMVLALNRPPFTTVEVRGRCVQAGGGAPLSAVIAAAAQRNLAGLEALVGIPGTIGGALRCNAGSRAGSAYQYLKRIDALDLRGQAATFAADDISPDLLAGEDLLVVRAEFELDPDDPADILKRLRKLWIHRKSQQPYSYQRCARLFKRPGNLDVEQMLEQAGVHELRVGAASLSERNLNYCIVGEGATARDVLGLIEQIKKTVAEKLGHQLTTYLTIW